MLMTNKEIIEDFRRTDYVSFIEYLDDWFYEDEEVEITSIDNEIISEKEECDG